MTSITLFVHCSIGMIPTGNMYLHTMVYDGPGLIKFDRDLAFSNKNRNMWRWQEI